MEEKKKCIYCKKVLPLSEFYKNRDRPDGLDVLCKVCRKAVQRKKTYHRQPIRPRECTYSGIT